MNIDITDYDIYQVAGVVMQQAKYGAMNGHVEVRGDRAYWVFPALPQDFVVVNEKEEREWQ